MKPRRAVVMLRDALVYRREIFCAGLHRLGYAVTDRATGQPEPGDVLVLWNRNQFQELLARRYENRGAMVLVAENGYIGSDDDGGCLFALAKRFHNGAGEWKVGDRERWQTQHIELKPWREAGEFLLILPQRGIGPAGVAMPQQWERHIASKIQFRTKRAFQTRHHPGDSKSQPYKDLRNAWAAVTWGSGAALKAIAAGIPAFYEMPQWIGAAAATFIDKKCKFENPYTAEREPMFERLAWAQWSTREIQTGEAFAWLLRS